MCVIFAANSVIIFMLVFSRNLLQVAAVLAFDGLSMGILDAGQVLELVFENHEIFQNQKKSWKRCNYANLEAGRR